jgi:hypothetical protein
MVLEGDAKAAFSRARLAGNLATLLRSGYPVLVVGRFWSRESERFEQPEMSGGLHAICVTGFRPVKNGIDDEVELFYAHDDNLGPNVRLRLAEASAPRLSDKPIAMLEPSSPPPRHNSNYADPTPLYPRLVPSMLIIAVHDELRVSSDALIRAGVNISDILNATQSDDEAKLDVTASARFIVLRKYLGDELARLLGPSSTRLGRVRLALVEDVPPMSLYLGLVRLSVGTRPALDILYDTTDGTLRLRAFAHVMFNRDFSPILDTIVDVLDLDLGVRIDAS